MMGHWERTAEWEGHKTSIKAEKTGDAISNSEN